MFSIRMSPEHRLMTVICLSGCFFVLELVIGFLNRSLALVADAFHVCSDLIGFGVALLAIRKARGDRDKAPKNFSYGWQRAELLGAFFNGVFLLALGVSILLQTIQRFVRPEEVTQPRLVLMAGGIGLGFNLLSAMTLGGRDTSPATSDDFLIAGHDSRAMVLASPDLVSRLSQHAGHAHASLPHSSGSDRDLGLSGVALHLLGDALNNIAVMISAIVIMYTGFSYADPLASLFVGFMIIATAWPLMRASGRFLLEGAPEEIDMVGVRSDIKRVKGVEEVHEVHVWNLTQSKGIATMHVATSDDSLRHFMESARSITECLHHWGIHNVTIQPELMDTVITATGSEVSSIYGSREIPIITPNPGMLSSMIMRRCQIRCTGRGCQDKGCCPL
ncbi:hypothetical protein JAAARDRAFT_129391 [Jaapia argillacea MUCL 33604]|uniref:Cation efflux protein cytoplasmic domain-containing protein n=1 Tax=Jaapia argillacea MUCL 33604 TaxID=933084 RepID=A0A067PU63_9AGAM|nr:hypothetical protein JAAARDRAFT_129391 [Jaapia argillacea MUCL 33604]